MGVEEKMSALAKIFDDIATDLDWGEGSKNALAPLDQAHDPLALSWASYRVAQSTGWRDYSWIPGDLLLVDHHMAAVTRRYYRDRIMVQALRNPDMTLFKKDLYSVCNGGLLLNRHRGMLCQLPYFYNEDTAQDQLREQFGSAQAGQAQARAPARESVTLIPVRKIQSLRRKMNTVNYWFRDHNNVLFLMDIDERNAYRPLLDGLYQRSQLCVTATMLYLTKLDIAHYKMINVVLTE
jgi:hypothetical protein